MAVDVVIPVGGEPGAAAAGARCVLASAGRLLGRVLLVRDTPLDTRSARALAALAAEDGRVEVLEGARALAPGGGDVVLLSPGARMTAGWLDELAAVATVSERVAAVVPLTSGDVGGGGPEPCPEHCGDALCLPLAEPRVTQLPTGQGPCLFLKRQVLALLGAPAAGPWRVGLAADEWFARARERGLVVLRANRVLVQQPCEARPAARCSPPGHDRAGRLAQRWAGHEAALADFARGPEAHVAALRASWLLGQRRVWVHGELPSLARALGQLGASADIGLPPLDGQRPHVCHVGGPVEDVATLGRLLRAGHLVITAEAVLEAERRPRPARWLTRAAAGAAQVVTHATLAAAAELRRLELPLPGTWVRVQGACPELPLGDAGGNFAAEVGGDWALLLDAHARVRARWRGPGEAPGLLLGGCEELDERVPGVRAVGDALPLYGARAYLAPSPTWGWPGTALAAAALGVPVISPRAGALPELLGEAGAWTVGWGAAALAERMLETANPERLGRAAEAAAARASALGVEAAAAALLGVYEAAVLRPSRAVMAAHAQLAELVPGGLAGRA